MAHTNGRPEIAAKLAKFVDGIRHLKTRVREHAPGAFPVAGQDGHPIKILSERLPLPARMTADSASAGRATRSTLQHALVGVFSAEQSIKGMAARPRMDVRAACTVQRRQISKRDE